MTATRSEQITMVQDHIRASSPCNVSSTYQWAKTQGLEDVHARALIDMINTGEAELDDDVIELLKGLP